MIEFLKQRSPIHVLVLIIFGIFIKLPLFLYPKTIVATERDEDLYHSLINFLANSSNQSSLVFSGIAFLLLLIQAFMINYFMNEYRMVHKQTFLPAFCYLLITSLLPEWNYLSSPLVANTLLIWAIIKLFRLYNLGNTRGGVFNIGLIIGITSYIYFPSAAFLICFLLGILILTPFRLNEIVIFFFGCFTPYYIYGAYLFLNDKFSIPNFFPHISVRVPEFQSTLYLAGSTILLALPFLIGGYFVQVQLTKMLIQVRKNWSILLLYMLIAFFVPFLNSYTSFNNWILLALPFTAFHTAAYFFPLRKWLPLVLFILTTGFILFQQYASTLWQ